MVEYFSFPLTVAEYFAGIGLVRMGLEAHGWEVVFANDISEKKYEMYNAFFPGADRHYVVDDVFNVDAAAVPPSTLATCSFPCIDLSLAGNMKGLVSGRHSSAFWGFMAVLTAQRNSAPPLILVENVPGWLCSNEGRDFRVTVEALNELGYACDVFTLDALRFTPQSRPRVFLIGTRLPPASTTAELILTRSRSLLSKQLRTSVVDNKDLRWFYNPIPEPPALHVAGLSRVIEDMSMDDARWWSEREVQRHLAMMDTTHRERVTELSRGEQVSYRAFFRRCRRGYQRAEVRDDDLSGCLRTAVGGSGKQFLIRAGQGLVKMRAMTPREYARLQGVPEEYPITVNGVQALTGFGDAVCVPAISWIARHVLLPLLQMPPGEARTRLPDAQLFLLEGQCPTI